MSEAIAVVKEYYPAHDWYNLLVEDCRSIQVETRSLARQWAQMELIRCKWLIGERICGDPNYEKVTAGRNSRSFIKQVAADLGASSRDIYYCVQFYESTHDLKIEATTPVEKLCNALHNFFANSINGSPSWRKILTQFLPPTRVEAEALESVPPAIQGDSFQLYHHKIEEAARLDLEPVDFIITDPPYPHEYLHLYKHLAELGEALLKPGGSLLAMVGQSYLPDILAQMTPILTYHWTICYHAPGAHTKIWQRNVDTGWKPVLWLVKGEYEGPWRYDVCKSDAPSKEFHEWGQSESGMASLIERFTREGELILDPFCGAGTTGVVATKLGRRFIGLDADPEAIQATAHRLGAVL